MRAGGAKKPECQGRASKLTKVERERVRWHSWRSIIPNWRFADVVEGAQECRLSAAINEIVQTSVRLERIKRSSQTDTNWNCRCGKRVRERD